VLQKISPVNYHTFYANRFQVGHLTARYGKNVDAYLEDVAAEELLHYLLALQLNLVEEDQQQFLSGDEGGLPHQLLVASGLELLGLETQSPGLRTLASCQTEKGLAGYLVLDLVL
jgi:hypothetical protein